MSQRVKFKATAPATREEMEVLVGEIAALKIQERATKADMDATIKNLKDGYTARLAEFTERLAVLLPQAHAWAHAHPEAFTGKSVRMLHGTIGWRVNPPSLKTLAGWTWDRVLEK